MQLTDAQSSAEKEDRQRRSSRAEAQPAESAALCLGENVSLTCARQEASAAAFELRWRCKQPTTRTTRRGHSPTKSNLRNRHALPENERPPLGAREGQQTEGEKLTDRCSRRRSPVKCKSCRGPRRRLQRLSRRRHAETARSARKSQLHSHLPLADRPLLRCWLPSLVFRVWLSQVLCAAHSARRQFACAEKREGQEAEGLHSGRKRRQQPTATRPEKKRRTEGREEREGYELEEQRRVQHALRETREVRVDLRKEARPEEAKVSSWTLSSNQQPGPRRKKPTSRAALKAAMNSAVAALSGALKVSATSRGVNASPFRLRSSRAQARGGAASCRARRRISQEPKAAAKCRRVLRFPRSD